MKIVEFLAPLKSATQRETILAAMLFLEWSQGNSRFTIASIRTSLAEARIPGVKNWNVAARLAASGHLVHSEGVGSKRTWELTDTGRKRVSTFAAALPAQPAGIAKSTEVEALRAQVLGIQDPESQAFASEAVDCLAIGAHRAAIVLMWVAGVYELQEKVWAASTPGAISTAAQTHNPKAKTCRKRDDLTEFNEELLLQIAQDLGVIDKNEKTELKKALDLRNGAGHPNKLRPKEHSTKAHIESIITILF